MALRSRSRKAQSRKAWKGFVAAADDHQVGKVNLTFGVKWTLHIDVMNKEVKSAWFILGVVALAVGSFAAAVPFTGLRPASAFLGLLGLTGLAPLLFPRNAGSCPLDERDRGIASRATLLAGIPSYLTVVMAGDAQMDPDELPAIVGPVTRGECDYPRGDRLSSGEACDMIPRVR